MILAGLGVSGGWQIIAQARTELRGIKSESRNMLPSRPRIGQAVKGER